MDKSNIQKMHLNGSGEGWIQATVNSASCGSIILPRADVYVGTPEYTFRVTRPDGYPVTNDEYGNLSFCPNTNYDIMVYHSSNYCPVYDLVWTVPSTWTTNYSSGYTISINTNEDPYNSISVDGKNCCNDDFNICMYFENSTTCDLYPTYSMIFSPNPSLSETIMTIVPNTESNFDETTVWDIEIYDSMRNLKSRISNLKGDRRTINTSGWNDGVYIVRARVKGKIVTGKLIVK